MPVIEIKTGIPEVKRVFEIWIIKPVIPVIIAVRWVAERKSEPNASSINTYSP
jgi:hypothetical protein